MFTRAPGLSVVITTHKSLDYLKHCIDSILAGATTGPEIVVYADGSGPETHDYLQQVCQNLRLRGRTGQLVFQGEYENVGISAATNRAAALASREWLYFINDDMAFAPGFDQALLKHAAPRRVLTGTVVEPERPNVGVADVHIRKNFGLWAKDFNLEVFSAAARDLAEDRTEPGINYPFCVQRSVFQEVGGVDERFAGPLHDPDLFYRFALAGCEMLRVRDSLCYHFSGRSLRFEGEKPTVSPRWIEQETAGKLMFLEKWGEKPRYSFGAVPRPGVTQPDQKWGPLRRLRINLKKQGYLKRAQKQMAAALEGSSSGPGA